MSGKRVVEVGKFAVVRDSVLAEHGVRKGDLVYVAGDMVVPDKKTDPYSRRQVFVAARVDGNGHILVNQGGFTIDGKRMTLVTDKRQHDLDLIKNADFDSEPESVSGDTASYVGKAEDPKDWPEYGDDIYPPMGVATLET